MDIRVADHLRNRFNIKVRRHQKAYGFTDPPVQQVLNRRESILLFYNVTQVIRTDEKVPRQKAQRKRLHTGVLKGPAGYRVTISYGVYPRCSFNINCQYIRLFPGADNIPLYSRIPAYAARTPCHRQASASSVPPAESSIPAPLRN